MSSTTSKTLVQDYAVVGQSVSVQVVVTNITGETVCASPEVDVIYDNEIIRLVNGYKYISAGRSYTFNFSFTMPDVTPTTAQPNRFVQVAGYTWVWNGNDWVFDPMPIGRQVRVMPPDPQFNVSVENAPANAFVWLFQYRLGYGWAQSSLLNMDSTWYSPFLATNAETSYEMFIYDEEGTTLQPTPGKVTLHTGGSYIYDYTTKTFRMVLHQAQSLSPSLPHYVEEFIPGYGSYNYNVTTRKFEKI